MAVEKKYVFTTKIVEEVTQAMNDGEHVAKTMNPWFKNNEIGVRKDGIVFAMTPEEIDEYIKCATDVCYFAEKYCQVKREDGSIGKISLRDYQKDILDLIDTERFVILCGSRQIGKCVDYNTTIELDDGTVIEIGELFYTLLETSYKLSFLEKFKRRLYRFIRKIKSKYD